MLKMPRLVSVLVVSLIAIACSPSPEGPSNVQHETAGEDRLRDQIRLPQQTARIGEQAAIVEIGNAVRSVMGDDIPSNAGDPPLVWIVLGRGEHVRYWAVGHSGVLPQPPPAGLLSPSLGPYTDVVASMYAKFPELATSEDDVFTDRGVNVLQVNGTVVYVLWARLAAFPPSAANP